MTAKSDAFHTFPLHRVAGGVLASDGTLVPVDSLPQALGYDGSSNLTSATVNYDGKVYIQTLTYTGSNLTGVSEWVLQ